MAPARAPFPAAGPVASVETVRAGDRATLVLALLAAALCLGTAGAYAGATISAGMTDLGPWLATLGVLGGSALGAAGLWQHLGDGLPRLIALVVLSALAAGYVAANAFALILGSAITWAPRPLHAAGLSIGAVLYVVGLVEASRAFMRTHASRR